jgi:hyperosmotically inducible periplasmic protein
MRMIHAHHSSPFTAVAILAGILSIAGCQNQPAHPDQKPFVTTALNNNNLSNVSVSQDRDKGVITLTGNVPSDGLKAEAETLAQQAAPNYTIANEIGVRPVGEEGQARAVSSSLDSAIEQNFRASIKAHRSLDKQSIDYKAKNGTLILTGSVKTDEQKKEAESLAKHVPKVQQVVNEIEVRPGKHSPANS